MTFQDMIALLSAVGVGSALGTLTKGLVGWFNGHALREKEANLDLTSQRDRAWALVDKERSRADEADARADQEAARARRALELASCYRGTLMRHGIKPDSWPEDLK